MGVPSAAEVVDVTWVLKCRPLRTYDKAVARSACLPYLVGDLRLAARIAYATEVD